MKLAHGLRQLLWEDPSPREHPERLLGAHILGSCSAASAPCGAVGATTHRPEVDLSHQKHEGKKAETSFGASRHC